MNQHKPWSSKDEKMLIDLYENGMAMDRIAERLDRTETAITVRLSLLAQESKIKYRPRKRAGGIPKKIRCIETGKEWKMMKDLATQLHCSCTCIHSHIRFREPMNGLHYEYA